MSRRAPGTCSGPHAPMPRPRNLGHGIGLRPPHYPPCPRRYGMRRLVRGHAENFMIPGGRRSVSSSEARALAPVALHAVSMNLGRTNPPNESHIDELNVLIRRFEGKRSHRERTFATMGMLPPWCAPQQATA